MTEEENLRQDELEPIPAVQTEEGETNDQTGSRIPGSLAEEPLGEDEQPCIQDQSEADGGRGEDPCGAEENCEDIPQVLAVSDPLGEDPGFCGEEDPRGRISELREELNRLEARITAKEAAWKRLEAECAEFRELYPGVPLEKLSDKVWEDVQSGIPIAAAFAVAERRRMLIEEKAQKSNAENKKNAPGTLAGSEETYFSPAEVRKMTPKQVRENYEKIMFSMQKWN